MASFATKAEAYAKADAKPERSDLHPCFQRCIDSHYDYPFWDSTRAEICEKDWKSKTYDYFGYTISPCIVHECSSEKHEVVHSFQEFMADFCGKTAFAKD
ncbi:uncharacterized protein K452DRAFT_296244 [Aplosporella prunicola CBS 121167]|uniref:Extracellular membrane protein CFEM domain-containing protein n=1 Tax=Aplosporella prunicola CBS 121167 TaxID=1176127 RepID=A0A6A6BIY5_9PEZI|nr:uncharacterized protein K452DRAFT_296244 [Aplosporella prunicola CBS 121167]KAF2143976.1 hypothetical protein K452DRAFT_296244 [Aplosporella prunicola CBS 121167]